MSIDINIIYSVIVAVLGSAGLWKVVEIIAQRGIKNQQNIYNESTSIRKELREDVARLEQQVTELNEKLANASKENLELQAEMHALRLENVQFRKENVSLNEKVEGLTALLERYMKGESRRTRTKPKPDTNGG